MKTLLKMVQDISLKLETDEVDTIMETPESEIITGIIRSNYEDLMSDRNWERQRKNITVAPYGTSRPTHVKLPDNIKEVSFINYDKRKTTDGKLTYEAVKHLHPDEFLRVLNARNSLDDATSVVTDASGMKLLIKTDAAPRYYTSFDDQYLVFDAYNSEIEDTIISSKIQSEGYFVLEWRDEDDFIPEIPEEMFVLLETAATRECFVNLKQSDNVSAAQRERRHRRAMSTRAWTTSPKQLYPNYGRKGRR